MAQSATPQRPLRPASHDAIDRNELISRYKRNRDRSRLLFDLLTDGDAHYSQPIFLRHPFVFYEGHLPAFSFNTLVKRALGEASIDPELEGLFARGIDPPTDAAAVPDVATNRLRWPSRGAVQQFAQAADERVIDALMRADIDRPGHPLLDRGEAAFVILEHEAMHQETLLYMLHQMPNAQKRSPAGYRPVVTGAVPLTTWIEIGPGRATLGIDRSAAAYAWDNECPRYSEPVPAFAIESGNVTNADFMDFVAAGGYRDQRWWSPADWDWVRREDLRQPPFWERPGRWTWRGLFETIPLPPFWPVYVTHAERKPTRAGEAPGSRPKRSSCAPRTEHPPGRTAPSRGAQRFRPRAFTASSTSRAGIRSPREATPTDAAPGAWTIWSATAGSGRARPSLRSPASGRRPPIRSTRPISSTAITSS